MASQKKIAQVESLAKIVDKNKNFILLKHTKTTHKNLEELRKNLKKNKSYLDVIKNTLFEKTINKLSAKDKLLLDLRKKFFPIREPSAIMYFDSDWSGGLNSLHKFIQKDKTVSFKFGLLDGQLYDQPTMERIAELPSKDQLIAKIIGSFKSPAQRLVYSMKFNLTKFAIILNQKSKKA